MGRGSLGVGTAVLIIILLITINMRVNESAQPPNSNSYSVGDEFGWDPTIDMEAWPRGKTFLAGDILEFKYDAKKYDVVVIDKEGHDTCTVDARSPIYDSGDDRIELLYGENYFICSIPSVCSAGLKMAIFAQFPQKLQQPRF